MLCYAIFVIHCTLTYIALSVYYKSVVQTEIMSLSSHGASQNVLCYNHDCVSFVLVWLKKNKSKSRQKTGKLGLVYNMTLERYPSAAGI